MLGSFYSRPTTAVSVEGGRIALRNGEGVSDACFLNLDDECLLRLADVISREAMRRATKAAAEGGIPAETIAEHVGLRAVPDPS